MYKLRIKVFLALLAAVGAVVIYKLVRLQVIEGREYRHKAEEAMRSVKVLPVRRGQITDRHGRILALDEPCFELCLHYRFLTSDSEWIARQTRLIARGMRISQSEAAEVYRQRSRRTWAVAAELAERMGTDLNKELQRIVARVEAVRRMVNRDRMEAIPVRDEEQAHPVVTGLDEAAAMRLRAAAEEMIGAEVQPSHKRWYPYARDACHVIGVTGKVWPEEIEALNLKEGEAAWLERMQANYLPGDAIGKMGVEKMCETHLRGRRGYERFRLTGETLEKDPGRQGGDVHLTLDIALQKRLAGLLEEKGFSGAIVVLATGTPAAPRCDVLAMVSVPTYDLNTYLAEYPRLLADEVNLPLMHRAVVQRYQPGSTIKPVTALAGLSTGVITLASPITCRGYLYNPDSFRCWTWKRGHFGHGPLEVVDALTQSCNVFFYEVGNRLGAARLCEWLAMMGFQEPPGTGLPSELAGTVPTERWVRSRLKRSYRPGDARFAAVGQGLLTVTPTHVANAMATIARDGVFLSPMVVLEGGPPQVRRDLPVTAGHLRAVQEGMYRVVNHRQGTAYKYFHETGSPPLEGIEICGKTGTATTAPQRIDTNDDGRISLEDDIVRQGDTAWFAGFAPYRNPQIAFAVTIEYVATGGGGSNAGPIAKEVVRICRELGYVEAGAGSRE